MKNLRQSFLKVRPLDYTLLLRNAAFPRGNLFHWQCNLHEDNTLLKPTLSPQWLMMASLTDTGGTL